MKNKSLLLIGIIALLMLTEPTEVKAVEAFFGGSDEIYKLQDVSLKSKNRNSWYLGFLGTRTFLFRRCGIVRQICAGRSWGIQRLGAPSQGGRFETVSNGGIAAKTSARQLGLRARLSAWIVLVADPPGLRRRVVHCLQTAWNFQGKQKHGR